MWHYYRDEPFLDNNGTIADFPANDNNSASFKYKRKIAGKTENYGTTNNIRVPLKYLGYFLENSLNAIN